MQTTIATFAVLVHDTRCHADCAGCRPSWGRMARFAVAGRRRRRGRGS